MVRKLALIAGLTGARGLLPAAPAMADGIGVMRFGVNNQAPRAKAKRQPSRYGLSQPSVAYDKRLASKK